MFTKFTIVFTHDEPITRDQARSIGEMVPEFRWLVPLEIDDWDLEPNLTHDPFESL